MLQSIPLSTLDGGIVLKLAPNAVIEGRVAATGDDHPEGVQVSLLTRRFQDGIGRWQQMSQATTNSRGEYRFGDLQPGEYKLVTREWSDEPAQRQEYDKPVPRYAPVHFPAGSAAASGPDVRLAGGETLQANFHLHPQTVYPVRVPVALPGNTNGGLQTRVLQEGTQSGYNFRYNAREKLAEGLLPSGSFELALFANGPESASAIVPVVVSGKPLDLPPVTLLPTLSIPVIVHQDFTGKTDTRGFGLTSSIGSSKINVLPLQLSVVADDMSFTNTRMVPDKNDPTRLNLERIGPGAYTVAPFATRGYVASVTSGGTNLLQHPLVVSAGGGAQPIEVTLRDDGGAIQGTVDFSSLPACDPATPGTVLGFILCLPAEATTIRAQQSIVLPGGKFNLRNVPPGTYRIFVSRQSFDQMEYRSEAWLKANGSKAATVTVEPSGTATVTLTSILDEAP